MPSGSESWILNVLLRLVVGFKGDILQLLHLGVLPSLLLADVFPLANFPLLNQLRISLRLGLHFTHRMLRISTRHCQEVITVNYHASLLHDPVWSLSSGALDVPHEVALIAIFQCLLDLGSLLLREVILETFVETPSHNVVPAADETVAIKVI